MVSINVQHNFLSFHNRRNSSSLINGKSRMCVTILRDFQIRLENCPDFIMLENLHVS
jgi:hypothetical protein